MIIPLFNIPIMDFQYNSLSLLTIQIMDFQYILEHIHYYFYICDNAALVRAVSGTINVKLVMKTH